MKGRFYDIASGVCVISMVVTFITGEIAWLYACLSEGQWFWLAVGITIAPAGPVYGWVRIAGALIAGGW